METSLHPLWPTKTSPATPPFGPTAPRWLRQLSASPLRSLLCRRPSQILNQGQNPQSGIGGAAIERDIVCGFGNAIVDVGRLGTVGIGWGDVVGD
ncbi:hypothetical protein SO802_027702 [Lithocarpus litseifolius]|uniref:Uncharacterized protein n=1 Tax=Lithocarpus litseifolius TaxID=425828 RepID=A0AAW2C5P6_9ROSI